MALRSEDFTPQERADVAACERSARALEEHKQNPAYIQRVIDRVNDLASRPRAMPMTSEQFLEQTAIPEE